MSQQQQAVAQPSVAQPAAEPVQHMDVQQQEEAPPQLSLDLNADLNDLDAINEAIARGTAHLRAVGKRGVTLYDMDEKFQKDMQVLREKGKELEAASRDHWALVKEKSGVAPERLRGWDKLMNSTDPEKQEARSAVQSLACANAKLMEQVTSDLKRRHEEEKAELRKQLAEEFEQSKKMRYTAPSEARREVQFSATQKTGATRAHGGQFSLVDSIQEDVLISRSPMANDAFKKKFLNPEYQRLERKPNYTVDEDRAILAAQLTQKRQAIDAQRY